MNNNRWRNSDATKTRIKVCGFTRAADVAALADADIDAIGLVFYPPSSRNVTIEQACEIVREASPFTCVTALFLNAERDQVQSVLDRVPINLLQFHGTEFAQFCESFARPYIKSVPMGSVTDIDDYCRGYGSARGFLLDSNVSGAAGGSGDSFDWARAPSSLPAPLILAGGLSPDNVRTAVRKVRPPAVDVSSGVEAAKGIKDSALVMRFIEQVRLAHRD